MTTVALFGAAGKMGSRLAARLRAVSEIALLVVEQEVHHESLSRAGFALVDAEVAARDADVLVLAVPDVFIQSTAASVVPYMRPGTVLMTLDPAAAYAGRLPVRDDVAYFVAHPAHPPIFPEDFEPESMADHFGEGSARQSIVCSLVQGGEEHYVLGERLARLFWGPILRSHRIELEHMTLLEPVLSETVLATCLTAVREALDEAVARGVPEAAARDFLFGHLRVELAILFNLLPITMSDGALQAIEEARSVIFKPDWKQRVFDPTEIRASTLRITELPK